jgi:WD40 repeat protein
MNNYLRVWDVANGFTLKRTLDSVPQEDLNFVEWHQSAPLLLTGGKDYMVWMVNAQNGKVMANFIGHEDEVIMAQFTKNDGGKQIISSSSDGTIRVWSPLQSECLKTIRNGANKQSFHEDAVQCFALHPTKSLILTGGAEGKVFGANYVAGESTGCIGQH